jgi:hypothetical protein
MATAASAAEQMKRRLFMGSSPPQIQCQNIRPAALTGQRALANLWSPHGVSAAAALGCANRHAADFKAVTVDAADTLR